MTTVPDFFPHNLALLKEHHPRSWKTVTGYQGARLGEFVLSADGNINLVIKKEDGKEIYFHDTQTTDNELGSYYRLVPENASGVVAFIGMGLGYTPPAMLRDRKTIRHLLVFEPEIGIFIQAMQVRDLSDLLTDPRVTLAIGPDVDVGAILQPMGRDLQLESIYVLKHNPCFHFSAQLYNRIHDEVYAKGNAYNMEGNTLGAHGHNFVNNRLRHMSSMHHHLLLEHLKGLFRKVPAILVAGGPSLDKNVHLLTQAKGRAVIIAADTALPTLVAHGVTPDFTTCIDMQGIVLEKFIDVADQARDTALVCSAWVHASVPKVFPARQIYWTFMAKNMERWLNGCLGGSMLTTGAGTVAQLSFTTSIVLGCSPIVFVGQDLAYTGDKSHADKTVLAGDTKAQEINAGKGEVVWVEGYGGGKVPTSRAFLSYKKHFEESIAAEKDHKFINATEGGVRLVGTEELPLHEVIRQYCPADRDIRGAITKLEQGRKDEGRKRYGDEIAALLKHAKSVDKDRAKLERLTEGLRQKISVLRARGVMARQSGSLPANVQRQIADQDKLSAKVDKARVWPLLEEVTLGGLRQSERYNHEISKLAGKPEHYMAWLHKSLQRLQLINQVRRQVLGSFLGTLKKLAYFLQRENTLERKLLGSNSADGEAVSELLRLYYENEDLNQLEYKITGYGLSPDNSAEVSFYFGAIAAYRSQFERMEHYFAEAVRLDGGWQSAVASCRERLADKYFAIYQENRRGGVIFPKVLHYRADHPGVLSYVEQDIRKDLEKSNALIMAALNGETDFLPQWDKGLVIWYNLFFGLPDTYWAAKLDVDWVATVGPENAAVRLTLYGRRLLDLDKFPEAVDAFKAALIHTPDDPQIHYHLADTCFAMGDFNQGVAALDRSVSLDRTYAKHWRELGDSLWQAGQPADAVAAYEKCFTALPEEIELLKKMGDCYLVLDQAEAARAAYQLYQDKLTRA